MWFTFGATVTGRAIAPEIAGKERKIIVQEKCIHRLRRSIIECNITLVRHLHQSIPK
jgi:hypothetical protein